MWYSLLDLEVDQAGAVRAQVTVGADSPWFSGHFPGAPVLPGIAQLKMVIDAIAASRGENLCIQGLNRIKFKDIVRPGEILRIRAVAADSPGQYAFTITTNRDKEVCSGMVRLAATHRQAEI